MENDSHPEEPNELSQEEMLEKAKQLLTLTNLVEMYPAVAERRVMGLIFILIGGAISFATLIFTNILNIVGFGEGYFLWFLAFVILCLGLGFGITIKLITPIYKSISKTDPSKHEMSKGAKIAWGFFTSLIILISVYATITDDMFLFVIYLQIIMAFGNGGNYYESIRNPSGTAPAKELLVFALAIALSIIPMLLFMEFAYTILIVVDMGGLFVIGIYMLLTAEKMLLDVSGR